MSETVLQQIQAMQFASRPEAEKLALEFTRQIFSPDVVSVELRPLAVSLNSFNGFLSLRDGRRLFFKTHTESDNIIGEYYNASMLAEAGYPVIRPIFSSTEAGKQLLIYEVIEAPSVFDIAWEIENDTQGEMLSVLTEAQNNADDALFSIYLNTLSWQTAEANAAAPVHQLFYHRLVGGRLERFYADDHRIALPGVGEQAVGDLMDRCWIINGSRYNGTLRQLIQASIHLLTPDQAGPVIVGHGDAHNGNVFLEHTRQPPGLLYFDPAFAGRHHPLLDLTKPLFHNVFAMWMYHPHVKRSQHSIQLNAGPGYLEVEHDYTLHPLRQMFFESKVSRVLVPILRTLRERGWLMSDWRAFLKAALFCCPFLTMNLADAAKFPPEISLLGLVMAVEMGMESAGQRSFIDQQLDAVALQL